MATNGIPLVSLILAGALAGTTAAGATIATGETPAAGFPNRRPAASSAAGGYSNLVSRLDQYLTYSLAPRYEDVEGWAGRTELIAALGGVLESGSVPSRFHTALILGRIESPLATLVLWNAATREGNSEVYRALVRSLVPEDRRRPGDVLATAALVRKESVAPMLRRLVDERVREAVPFLLSLARARPEHRQDLVKALAELGDRRVIGHLTVFLDQARDPVERRTIEIAVARLRGHHQAWSAADASSVAIERTVSRLIEGLSLEYPLRPRDLPAADQPHKLIPVLDRILLYGAVPARRAIIGVLADLQDPAAQLLLLERAAFEADSGLRQLARQQWRELTGRPGPTATTGDRAPIDRETWDRVLDAVASGGAAHAAPILVRLASRMPEHLPRTLRCLGDLRAPEALPHLRTLRSEPTVLQDPDLFAMVTAVGRKIQDATDDSDRARPDGDRLPEAPPASRPRPVQLASTRWSSQLLQSTIAAMPRPGRTVADPVRRTAPLEGGDSRADAFDEVLLDAPGTDPRPAPGARVQVETGYREVNRTRPRRKLTRPAYRIAGEITRPHRVTFRELSRTYDPPVLITHLDEVLLQGPLTSRVHAARVLAESHDAAGTLILLDQLRRHNDLPTQRAVVRALDAWREEKMEFQDALDSPVSTSRFLILLEDIGRAKRKDLVPYLMRMLETWPELTVPLVRTLAMVGDSHLAPHLKDLVGYNTHVDAEVFGALAYLGTDYDANRDRLSRALPRAVELGAEGLAAFETIAFYLSELFVQRKDPEALAPLFFIVPHAAEPFRSQAAGVLSKMGRAHLRLFCDALAEVESTDQQEFIDHFSAYLHQRDLANDFLNAYDKAFRILDLTYRNHDIVDRLVREIRDGIH